MNDTAQITQKTVYFKKYKFLNFGNESFVSELGINNNLQMRYTSFLTFSSLKDTVLYFLRFLCILSPENY